LKFIAAGIGAFCVLSFALGTGGDFVTKITVSTGGADTSVTFPISLFSIDTSAFDSSRSKVGWWDSNGPCKDLTGAPDRAKKTCQMLPASIAFELFALFLSLAGAVSLIVLPEPGIVSAALFGAAGLCGLIGWPIGYDATFGLLKDQFGNIPGANLTVNGGYGLAFAIIGWLAAWANAGFVFFLSKRSTA